MSDKTAEFLIAFLECLEETPKVFFPYTHSPFPPRLYFDSQLITNALFSQANFEKLADMLHYKSAAVARVRYNQIKASIAKKNDPNSPSSTQEPKVQTPRAPKAPKKPKAPKEPKTPKEPGAKKERKAPASKKRRIKDLEDANEDEAVNEVAAAEASGLADVTGQKESCKDRVVLDEDFLYGVE
ncbi:hypothetical protein RUND412_006967 [Rhizina undulata]